MRNNMQVFLKPVPFAPFHFEGGDRELNRFQTRSVERFALKRQNQATYMTVQLKKKHD